MEEKKRRAKAVIVGGSIAGISSAHALISAGWDVLVLEKSAGPPTGSPTGAGLGLDPLSHRIIRSWLPPQLPDLLHKSTVPLTVDQNQATDDRKVTRILARDENFNFRAAHWADLLRLLYDALPPNIFLWGHLYLSFRVSEDKTSVTVKANVLQTDQIIQIEGNLLVAADGCLSSVRRSFLPDFKLRYSGYCAWRGVLNFSGNENSETIKGMQRAYPDLGKCLYFDLGYGTHSVFYELLNKRLNWIWYINQPEPEMKGNSVTMKVSNDTIKNMHREAEKVWVPELARVIKETKEPFINAIYDSDPLKQIFWSNVVLIGDAAHPTTPHGLRSTNMSIVDAAVLGKCLYKWGADNLISALKEYQSIRLPVTSKQVLHSRRVGRIKQGLALPDREPFNPKTASPQECQELQQKVMPFFSDIPPLGQRDMILKKEKQKAIIVGGSIGGLSCAKALILAGWDVVVLEKSHAPPMGSPTGAGLGLDTLAQEIIQSWLSQPELLHRVTLPLTIDQNLATDGAKKVSWVLTRDENLNFRVAHWTDLHGLLYNALPNEIFQWGHLYLSSCISDDKTFVKVKAKVLQTDEIVEVDGDLLVAADGSRSSVRQCLLPDVKLRYSGYCAWRGVLDFSECENSETIVGIRKAYPDLGNCLYMDLGSRTHSTLTELMYKRLNWIWFVNQPEPELKGNSVTMKVSNDMIRTMHREADKVWVPELAGLVKETKDPFVNIIYDCDPVEQIVWDRVVLIGEAAHPTTPHCGRSTNMSILDAAVLGKCLDKWWGADENSSNLQSALEEYQSIRLPVTSKQVLHSRKVGRIKQGLRLLPDRQPFDPKAANSPEDWQDLQQRNIPHFADVPSILDSMFCST